MPSRTPSPQPSAAANASTVGNVKAQRAPQQKVVESSRCGRNRGRGGPRMGSRGGTRRTRGKGRGGRGLGASLGGILSRTQSSSAQASVYPFAGWRIVPSTGFSLSLEKDYIQKHVSLCALLFCSAPIERPRVELDVKKLKASRSHVFVLLCDELVNKCCEWLNDYIVLKNIRDKSVTGSNVYRYLAVMFFSQCTDFSFRKTLDVLGILRGKRLNAEILNFINSNILSYSATGRGDDDSLVWNEQRDQTVMLSPFERAAFRMTVRIFINPNHTILSFDDDLMGTLAVDIQVKTVTNCKADGEGHTADVLADALFRVVLQILCCSNQRCHVFVYQIAIKEN